MAHDQNHNHHHSKRIGVAFFLNLSFTIIEIIGGLWTSSMAILSDALHDLGDSMSLGAAWYLQRVSGKKRDDKFSYGYKRFSVLGALITSVILLAGSIIIISKAVPRLFSPDVPNYKGMMLLAVLGVVVNGAAMLKLRGGSSLNEQVVSLHMLEDVLGWVAVLIGSIVMYFFDWPIIDPLLSIGIAIYILFNVYKNLKSSLKIFLQAIPQDFNTGQLAEKLVKQFSQIQSIHDVHLWTLDGEMNIMTLHAVLTDPLEMEELSELKVKIRELLHDQNVEHLTIEFETEEEQCALEDC